jgi:hypothetical protein
MAFGDPVTPAEATAWEWVGSAFGWVMALLTALGGWIIREAFLRRLELVENTLSASLKTFEEHNDARFHGIEERMRILEKLAAAVVTPAELTRSVDGLRDEIRATRLEIKDDVRQLADLFRRQP